MGMTTFLTLCSTAHIQMTNQKKNRAQQNKTKDRAVTEQSKMLEGKNSDLLMSSRLSTGDFQINIYDC